MKVFWIVFATVYILGWVWLCYSAMHAPSDLDLWGEEIEYVIKTIIICTLYIIYRPMRR